MEESVPVRAADGLSEIHEIVRRRTGLDLGRYRAAMIARRIANRMISVGVPTLPQYVEFLRGREGEVLHLIRHISIKVSRFYRNPVAFDCLRLRAMPELRDRAPVKVWSIGCARGEEAYTLAMLLEACGVAGTVYATDIDRDALAAARDGHYGDAAVADVPADLREAFLHACGDGWRVADAVKRRVSFAWHDATSGEAPSDAGSFDLVACRNMLIYLRQEVQPVVFRMIDAALAPQAFLFLGEAEWLPSQLATGLRNFSPPARLFRQA